MKQKTKRAHAGSADPETPQVEPGPGESVEEPAVEAPALEEVPQVEPETPVPADEQSADVMPLDSESHMQDPEMRINQVLSIRRCINCGQNDRPLIFDVKPNHVTIECPVCKHKWTPADEQAPFRRIQRGEKG